MKLAAEKLKTLIRERRRVLDAQKKLNQQALAWVRSNMSFEATFDDEDDKAREAIKKKSETLLRAMQKDKADEKDPVVMLSIGFVTDCRDAESIFKMRRRHIEKMIERAAKDLPIAHMVEETHGLGWLGLGIIVGESGALDGYSHPGKLHKRFGLVGFKGKCPSKWRRSGGASADDWVGMGYSPTRRSALWTIGDSMIKSQIQRVRDDEGEVTDARTAKGKYGQVYLDVKAAELAREDEGKPESPMHAHRRAQLMMEKQLLTDLRAAWLGADDTESEDPRVAELVA